MKLRSTIAALHAALIAILLAVSPAGAGSMTLLGAGNAGGGGAACTTSTFAKDGTTVGNNATATSVATTGFSTTFCNNLVVAGIVTNAASVSSVTDAQGHLTFTKRSSVFSSGNELEIWTAPLSGAALSGDAITVTVASSAFTTIYVNSFSGYKTATPFDPNAALPSATVGQCSWTTTNANDILYGFGVNTATASDAGYTLLSDASNSGWFDFGEYKVVTATQAGTTAATLSTQVNICDAIQKGP